MLPGATGSEIAPGHFADGTGVVAKWRDAFTREDRGGVDERWW
ncbi:hypothetical protein [Streptomyces omiyaensis]|nr:hypothetical protein [Streptomyces omiyaensis]GGY62563.1 hypothetical protein GCM10010363_50110 [Streptomyces omiyaensis]